MYKLHLILKYLLKRRIAWVSLAAVMLCTTMVLVVISVMGGWLNMFKSSFRGLAGDLVVHTDSSSGFAYYQQIIAELQKDPDIQAAVPSIEVYGLINFGSGPRGVRVMGIPLAKMGTVNRFPESLYRQHTRIVEQLKNPDMPQALRQRLERELREPPSFDLLDELKEPMPNLPTGLKYAQAREGQTPPKGTIAMPPDFPDPLQGRLRYDALRKNLMFEGRMETAWKPLLASLSPDPGYKKAIDALYVDSQNPNLFSYDRVKGKKTGLIAGVGVIGIHRDRSGAWDRYTPETEYGGPIALTVLDLSHGNVGARSGVTRTYVIVDDSHLGVWQYDNMYVYVPLDTLQKDLGLDEQMQTLEISDTKTVEVPKPAAVTDIHIKVKPNIDANNEAELEPIRERVQSIVNRVTAEAQAKRGALLTSRDLPIVETWQDTVRIWINAVENEKLLTVMLFGIMCIVAIFLIFCIFYMIVAEKTRDIGIIKSVGATSSGVAGIFLGYGLVIGIIGAALGFLLSFLIVHYINQMHAWLGREFKVQIWNPEVYQFDKIPNTMSAHDVAWIIPTAILASVLGALIPAIRAARMNPVQALRWE